MYPQKFPTGSIVRIAERHALERFRQTWKLHNPLLAEQFVFAGSSATIGSVGFYHGGAVLYVLEDIPCVARIMSDEEWISIIRRLTAHLRTVTAPTKHARSCRSWDRIRVASHTL
jgi:hypothetical protein